MTAMNPQAHHLRGNLEDFAREANNAIGNQRHDERDFDSIRGDLHSGHRLKQSTKRIS